MTKSIGILVKIITTVLGDGADGNENGFTHSPCRSEKSAAAAAVEELEEESGLEKSRTVTTFPFCVEFEDPRRHSSTACWKANRSASSSITSSAALTGGARLPEMGFI